MEFARRIDISNATLAKFGKNEPVTLTIIDRICNEFNCNINDVVIHTNDNSELIPQDFLYPGVIVSTQCYPINLSVRRTNEKQRNKASVNYPCIIIAKNKNDSTFFLVAPLNLTRDPETILDIAFSNSIINGVNMHGFVQISKMGIVRSSFIPSKDFRILRELTRYIYKLTCIRSSEKNRYTNALTVGNCKLDMTFSDIFGKSSQSIIDIILNNDSFSDEDIIRCLRKNCKSSHEDILASVSGLSFTTEQKLRIKIVEDHIDYLTNQINTLRDIVDELIKPYENYINLLMTIPGIDRNSAITIISEIGTDMSQFKNHYRLASWAGLAPGCNESAGKKKSVKISRAGVYLKPCLVEVAHCAVKDKANPYYANKFNKISKRRGKKRSTIAIARKILVAIYHL